MQLDRILVRTMARLARTGIAGLRVSDAGETRAPEAAGTGQRGSGSWANEWAGARSVVARAKSLASPGRKRAAARAIPGGTIRIRPLMAAHELKLHNWIADRLEARAPTCSLHAGVALGAFLSAATSHEGHDPLAGLIADLLIVDEKGRPVTALIREHADDTALHLRLLDALLDADLPIVDLPDRPVLSALWTEISVLLPRE